jgi:hypothetical protein
MSICADQKMTRVVGIEIHHYICRTSTIDDETFGIIKGRNSAEWTRNIVSRKWAILTGEIGHAMWRPEP